jgi:hypothetical protein
MAVWGRGEVAAWVRQSVTKGTTKAIADRLEMLHYETGANGGFILGRGFHATDNIREFVDLVVPELQRRGLSKKQLKTRLCAPISTTDEPGVRPGLHHPALRNRLTEIGI